MKAKQRRCSKNSHEIIFVLKYHTRKTKGSDKGPVFNVDKDFITLRNVILTQTRGGGEAETPATAKQRGCQLLAWLTSGNPVSACRHTVSSEDQPSSHSHHPVIKIIVISAYVGRTSPSSFLSEQNI